MAEESVDEVAGGVDGSETDLSWGPLRFPRARSVVAGSVLVVGVLVVGSGRSSLTSRCYTPAAADGGGG